eukprot:Nk52_evm2s188 gene=Nk52_evmTU2s188
MGVSGKGQGAFVIGVAEFKGSLDESSALCTKEFLECVEKWSLAEVHGELGVGERQVSSSLEVSVTSGLALFLEYVRFLVISFSRIAESSTSIKYKAQPIKLGSSLH